MGEPLTFEQILVQARDAGVNWIVLGHDLAREEAMRLAEAARIAIEQANPFEADWQEKIDEALAAQAAAVRAHQTLRVWQQLLHRSDAYQAQMDILESN
jgi:hypothetical protein